MMRSILPASRLGTAALLSVCLNLVLASYIATQWAERLRAPLAVAAPTRIMEMVSRRLPQADADILWRVYRNREEALSAAQADYRRALANAGGILVRPSLNGDALRAAVSDARNKRVAVGDLAIEVFIEALPQMSEQGRLGLLGALRPQ